MKLFTTILFSFLLIVCGLSQTRNVIVNTNNVVIQPTNFWSADITNARNGLGLGWSALTNTNSNTFRADIGLGWSALTNTNFGTSSNKIGRAHV